MRDALTFRTANSHDIDGVMRLVEDCIAAMRRAGIDQWDAIYPSRSVFDADIREGTLYLASGQDADLVGTVVLNEKQSPEYARVAWTLTTGRVGVVHRLMVAPMYQQQGTARALMAFAESRARESGYEVIRLDAFTRNPRALRLYEGLGYRDAGPVTLRKGLFRCFEKSLVQR